MGAGTNFPDGVLNRGLPVDALGGGSVMPITFNNILYVDGTNGNDTNDGKSPGSGGAKSTLEGALSASLAKDIIIIEPGTYTLATANLPFTPKANQVWMAANYNPQAPNVILTDDGGGSDTDLVDLEVDNVKFVGFKFQAAHADVARLVKISDTVSITGLTFLGCMLDGNSLATVNGLSLIDATYFPTGLVAVNCRFKLCDIGISVGVKGFPDALIEHCFFDMQDAGGGDVGIQLADTSALATGYGFQVRDCDFLGAIDAGGDSVGIVIGGTEDTTAIGCITNNRFYYCGTAPITIDKIGKSIVQNYYGDATGGLLVDVGT